MRFEWVFVFASSLLLGQAVNPPPKYTVAIVTPNQEASPRRESVGAPSGPWKVVGVTLKDLIEIAYLAPGFRVFGGPDWVNTDRWNFHMETNPIHLSKESTSQLLRRALEDRFQLKAHLESRVLPVYEMHGVGFKLQKISGYDSRGPVIKYEKGSIQLRDASLDSFARLLSDCLGRTVVNKTGKPGDFRFALEWTPSYSEITAPQGMRGYSCPQRTSAANTDAPSIFVAMQEQLGLRLIPTNGPVEVVVIDRAEKPR